MHTKATINKYIIICFITISALYGLGNGETAQAFCEEKHLSISGEPGLDINPLLSEVVSFIIACYVCKEIWKFGGKKLWCFQSAHETHDIARHLWITILGSDPPHNDPPHTVWTAQTMADRLTILLRPRFPFHPSLHLACTKSSLVQCVLQLQYIDSQCNSIWS